MIVKKELKNEKKGQNSIVKNEILIRLAGSEILERQVSGFGTGCHVIVPKEYLGKKVKIILEGEK
jgi:putative transposon-encoded protein